MAGNYEIVLPSQAHAVDIKSLLTESRELEKSGRSRDALKLLEDAEIRIKLLDNMDKSERNLSLGRICVNKGITLKNMKAWEKSAACYEDALKYLSESGYDAFREKISIEINLAILKTRRFDRKGALEGFDRAEKLAEAFEGKDREELMTKILMNRAQLHLEFNEIDKARELLDRVSSLGRAKGREDRRERQVRVSAQLGQLMARIAEESKKKDAKEHFIQALKLFEESINCYNELGLWRDCLLQKINHAEVLTLLGNLDEAASELGNVLSCGRERNELSLSSSAAEKLLDIALRKKDPGLQDKWLSEILSDVESLPEHAGNDLLERLEVRLRLDGHDALVDRIKVFQSVKSICKE